MVLQTKRLLLREFLISDAQSLFDLNSDPEVLKFTGDVPFNSLIESKEFLEKYSEYSSSGYGRWAVVDKSTNTFIGWCGLKYHPNESYTDLGFRFFKTYWNQGYATEAGSGVINLAFSSLKLNSLVARVQEENVGSIRVLEKLGFIMSKKISFNSENGLLFRLSK